MERFRTGNSRTPIPIGDSWLVLDLGSGHSPHPRADILVDRTLGIDKDRAGRESDLTTGRPFVQADGCALPFKDNSFDFAVCSHVAEHVDEIDGLMGELSRVSRAGYIETPSKFAEILRPQPMHRWYVSAHQGVITFEPTREGYRLGPLGRLFYSLYFYGTVHTEGKDVYPFAHGLRPPLGYALKLLRLLLMRSWLLLKPITYTRVLWNGQLSWTVRRPGDQR